MSRPIGEVPTRTFNPGDVIFKEGDDAKSEAFLVHQGKVEIRKNLGGEEKLLRELSQGMLLGEFALFRNIPRSATAIAADAVTLMVIPANRLDAMVRTNPGLAMAIIKDLVSRMLAAEDRAREAEERSRMACGARATSKPPASSRSPGCRVATIRTLLTVRSTCCGSQRSAFMPGIKRMSRSPRMRVAWASARVSRALRRRCPWRGRRCGGRWRARPWPRVKAH